MHILNRNDVFVPIAGVVTAVTVDNDLFMVKLSAIFW